MKIVIPTCDTYSYLIPPNILFLKKYWPECPHGIVVVGGKKKIDVPEDVEVVYLGEDHQFASNMINFLDHHYNEKHLLVWFDDYFMYQLDREVFTAAAVLAGHNEVSCVRLSQTYTPEGKSFEPDDRFCYIDREEPYSFSQQAAIWRTDHYRSLLWAGENPWETELEGSTRVKETKDKLGEFLGVTVPCLDYKNFCYQGGVDRGSAEWALGQLMEEVRGYGFP